MNKWNERSREVANLLNPAFCGRVIFSAIKEFVQKSNNDFPFPLVYLILPLVLHKQTREKINSRKHLLLWIKENQNLMIGFAKRAKSLVQISNEAIEMLMQAKLLELTDEGKLTIPAGRKFSNNVFTDSEIEECLRKSEHVARWFIDVGKIQMIYIGLGVRP